MADAASTPAVPLDEVAKLHLDKAAAQPAAEQGDEAADAPDDDDDGDDDAEVAGAPAGASLSLSARPAFPR